MLLMAIKVNYPKSFILLRGNHECRNMTDHFTFRSECIRKFDQDVYKLFMEVFDALPLSWRVRTALIRQLRVVESSDS